MRPERAKVFDVYNILELLPLQGVVQCTYFYPRCCLGLWMFIGLAIRFDQSETHYKLILNTYLLNTYPYQNIENNGQTAIETYNS